jgi:hypothetical protein
MPKALSGEMPADPLVPIDRPEHHSFNRRVKGTAPNAQASSATLRGMLPQVAARSEIAKLMLTRPTILGFITEWVKRSTWTTSRPLRTLHAKGVKTIMGPIPIIKGPGRGTSDRLLQCALGSPVGGDLLSEGHGLRKGRFDDPVGSEGPV